MVTMPKLPPPSNLTTGEPSFRWRRISFFVIVGYGMLSIPVLPYLPPLDDNDLEVVKALIDMIGWAFLIYATGAGAQDIAAIISTRSGRPYADNVQSTAPPPPDQTVVVAQTNVQQPPAGNPVGTE